METNYSVTIKEAYKDLTPREKIRLKDTSDAISLDSYSKHCETADETCIIEPAGYAVLDIHNEKASEPDYEQFLIIDTEGNKYVTGSDSFYHSFKNIWDELKDEAEPWQIKIMRKPSKNFSGDFITCSLL